MTAKSWEVLLKEATEALEAAEKAIDDIAGWSGSSGNWPLHESLDRVQAALKELRKP